MADGAGGGSSGVDLPSRQEVTFHIENATGAAIWISSMPTR
jgi:hypothetical protein